jgi:hypothetical protein
MTIGRSVASVLAATAMMFVAPAVKAADAGVEAVPLEAAIPSRAWDIQRSALVLERGA